MRLLNTSTRRIKEFRSDGIPPYAILSHTWGSEDVSFQEMMGPSSGHLSNTGFDKIAKTCEVDVGEKSNGFGSTPAALTNRAAQS